MTCVCVCVWQEGVGSSVAKAVDRMERAVSDAADEVVDGVEKMLREEDE